MSTHEEGGRKGVREYACAQPEIGWTEQSCRHKPTFPEVPFITLEYP